MNYNLSTIQRIYESWNQFTSECLHSGIWYQFILSTALLYYVMVVLSMVFSKESRRFQEISLLHDNLIMFILMSSWVEWFGFATNNSTELVIPLSSRQKIQVGTCSSIVFLHASLQASSVMALAYTIYAENVLLRNMAFINPQPIFSIRLLAFQVMTGLTVSTTRALIDASDNEDFTNGCCLHPVSAWSFKKMINLAFDFSSIYAAYILLRVSIDRFLKLIVNACQRPWFMIDARLHIL